MPTLERPRKYPEEVKKKKKDKWKRERERGDSQRRRK
jgi:hypothetical protein